jgi:hypothetical protein
MEPIEHPSQDTPGDTAVPGGRSISDPILYVVTADFGYHGHQLIRVSFGRPTPEWLETEDKANRSSTGYGGLRVHEVEIVSRVSVGKVRPDGGF